MLSEYVRDDDPDLTIKDAFKERPGKPLHLRLQPMILRKDGQYHAWRRVRWTLACDSAGEAFDARDLLRTFFDALNRCGPSTLKQLLLAAKHEGRPEARAVPPTTTTTPPTTTTTPED